MIEILNGRIEVDDVHNLGHPPFPVQFFPTTSSPSPSDKSMGFSVQQTFSVERPSGGGNGELLCEEQPHAQRFENRVGGRGRQLLEH